MMNCQIGSKIHKYPDFENCIDEEDLPHFRKAIHEALKDDVSLETVFRTKPIDGETRFISTKSLITRNKSGKPVAMTCVCFDVTGMKRGTEQALINLNEELLRSNKDLHQFAYVASHDLQEPLRMVSSFTQMLQHRYGDKLDDDAKEYIRFAVDGSKRMYELINGLLAYSRVQTKGKEFVKVKMDRVVEKVIANLSIKIEERKAAITIRKLPVVFADENQMIQLLQNLIENSIKFSNTSPVISVSSRLENDYYIFSVKDNGIGIEHQYHDRIFQIFQRLHKRDEYDGTGIGLAICKRIAERHNGRIWLESFPGKGCTFFFSLPKDQIMYTA
jgi:light-regulated signal transduction histidine kinase (bacteriophytochrome)